MPSQKHAKTSKYRNEKHDRPRNAAVRILSLERRLPRKTTACTLWARVIARAGAIIFPDIARQPESVQSIAGGFRSIPIAKLAAVSMIDRPAPPYCAKWVQIMKKIVLALLVAAFAASPAAAASKKKTKPYGMTYEQAMKANQQSWEIVKQGLPPGAAELGDTDLFRHPHG